MENNSDYKRFGKVTLVTLIAVYLLILAGGIVRSTGSGMGCPDWPKCFGNYIPPTHISELPLDYKERYKVHGFEAEFNPVKTWIEYINRLMGAVVGFLMLLVVSFSVPLIKKDWSLFALSLLTLFLIGFEAWLGKLVVSSNLAPIMVTIHMGGSLVIVGLLIWILIKTFPQNFTYFSGPDHSKFNFLVIFLLILTFLQISIGTQVREEIDIIIVENNNANREHWIDSLGEAFLFHRIIGYALLILSGYLFFGFKKFIENKVIIRSVSVVFYCLLIEAITGIALAVFSLPPYLQPLHLLLATIVFGILFFVFTIINVNLEGFKMKAKLNY
ncbi:MAG: COX15/CtaA family protein [Sporocytophaga sp.]|nr:COX15/CtaA family protein [Sporocytophaga sp.]